MIPTSTNPFDVLFSTSKLTLVDLERECERNHKLSRQLNDEKRRKSRSQHKWRKQLENLRKQQRTYALQQKEFDKQRSMIAEKLCLHLQFIRSGGYDYNQHHHYSYRYDPCILLCTSWKVKSRNHIWQQCIEEGKFGDAEKAYYIHGFLDFVLRFNDGEETSWVIYDKMCKEEKDHPRMEKLLLSSSSSSADIAVVTPTPLPPIDNPRMQRLETVIGECVDNFQRDCTGRHPFYTHGYSYEDEKRRPRIHISTIKGFEDKWILVECEISQLHSACIFDINWRYLIYVPTAQIILCRKYRRGDHCFQYRGNFNLMMWARCLDPVLQVPVLMFCYFPGQLSGDTEKQRELRQLYTMHGVSGLQRIIQERLRTEEKWNWKNYLRDDETIPIDLPLSAAFNFDEPNVVKYEPLVVQEDLHGFIKKHLMISYIQVTEILFIILTYVWKCFHAPLEPCII